ncbi:sulfite exporter TauE/SafE family protein [Rubrimonas cliftonensis]|uniref:Probable membrane transporter protein n=1 Tax=Rubrimonas cliftonensis TaxID=89524 RepID=A0A1H4A5Q5_9RHOB|nr:sulfite exporter TauE/SafE family protein [Rubrimonas cliftonensis]SEA31286.1 hypothetical protein SAMN05444370_10481 [Rubrimonas cliftonensis]
MESLNAFIAAHGVSGAVAAAGILFLGGFSKGAVGFALPLIGVSLLGTFLPAQTAVALLILPMLLSNAWQSFREGVGEAWTTLKRYRLLLAVLLPSIAAFSQLLTVLSDRAFFGLLGAVVTSFAATQLLGWKPRGVKARPRLWEAVAGLVGGLCGGLAGVWGPPVTLYLLAIEAPKKDTMLALGVIFGLGAAALTVGQTISGVLNAQTAQLSALAVIPVAVGMYAGYAVHDRLDAQTFRRATLAVLTLTGLNLLRRALLG